MEVVESIETDTAEISSHHLLCFRGPLVSSLALCWPVWVDGGNVVASWSDVIASFHDHALDDWVHELVSGVTLSVEDWLGVSSDAGDEVNHLSTDLRVSLCL